jgi:hypothetical protein
MLLKINTLDKSLPFINPHDWYKILEKVKNNSNDKCAYCNLEHTKMTCIFKNKKENNLDHENMILCCDLCSKIVQCKYAYQKDFVLCWSKISQVEIVKRSIKYIKKYGKVPDIKTIDSNAKKLQLSLIEFLDLISLEKKLPKDMKKYKIFLTPYFDFSFVKLDIKQDNSYQSMFLNENEINNETNNDSDNSEDCNLTCTEEELIEQDIEDHEDYIYYLQRIEHDKDLPLHSFTKDESEILNKYYNPFVLNNFQIDNILNNIIKIQFNDEINFSNKINKYHSILINEWVNIR